MPAPVNRGPAAPSPAARPAPTPVRRVPVHPGPLCQPDEVHHDARQIAFAATRAPSRGRRPPGAAATVASPPVSGDRPPSRYRVERPQPIPLRPLAKSQPSQPMPHQHAVAGQVGATRSPHGSISSHRVPPPPVRREPPRPLHPKVSFQRDSPAADSLALRLPPTQCWRLCGSGIFWRQSYVPLTGPLFGASNEPAPRDMLLPAWSAAEGLATVAQALARQAPNYLALRFSPRADGIIVRQFVRDAEDVLPEHALLTPQAWQLSGMCWRGNAGSAAPDTSADAVPIWPDVLRQAYMQAHGGPASLLASQPPKDVLFWLCGRPVRVQHFRGHLSTEQRAACVAALFEAGEAVVVLVGSSLLSVQDAYQEHRQTHLRLLNARGAVADYPGQGSIGRQPLLGYTASMALRQQAQAPSTPTPRQNFPLLRAGSIASSAGGSTLHSALSRASSASSGPRPVRRPGMPAPLKLAAVPQGVVAPSSPPAAVDSPWHTDLFDRSKLLG